MAEICQQEDGNKVKTLKEKLSHLLEGQGSEVIIVLEQLRLAEQHATEGQCSYLQKKIASLEKENANLNARLSRSKEKIDTQEQFLSLSRHEQEELFQVKPNAGNLNSRLRLAEKGLDSVFEQSPERERSLERYCRISPLISPRFVSSKLDNTLSRFNLCNTQEQIGLKEEVEKHFENQVAEESFTPEECPSRKLCTNSMSVLGANIPSFNEMSELRRQIHDLQEENDVLKYELTQRNHGDSDTSGSDSEDVKISELQETCEDLREKLKSVETSERQCRDRLKLAEKHIAELEQTENVLRDRVEEGNTDCDKLRTQIIRLQRKLKELKEVSSDRDVSEQTMIGKVKHLKDVESQLSQKVTELERNNHILKQRLDVNEELLADVHLIETLTERVTVLEDENNELQLKLIDSEENNELLKETCKRVVDEVTAKMECLEEKIKVIECLNNELKDKLKDQDIDLNCSGRSIASEINDDAIEQLSERIKELENEISSVTSAKNKKTDTLENMLTASSVDTSYACSKSERKDSQNCETIIENVNQNQNLYQYSSNEGLAEMLNETEKFESALKKKILQMDKIHDEKQTLLQHDNSKCQHEKDDICVRIEGSDYSENNLKDIISKYQENEMNMKNKIEELENREIRLTVRFSERVEELEIKEKQLSDSFYLQIKDFESRESQLSETVKHLQKTNSELITKINVLEKYEQEISEKQQVSAADYSEFHHVSQPESNATVATVNLQDKHESFAKLECETSLCTNEKLTSLAKENNTFLMEIAKLQNDIKEFEKIQKTLEDKLKRQEKKSKRSERADNLGSYNSLSREVITYKMEIEQLRIENSDLHDRLMELDESEKSLIELCGKLKNDIFQMEKNNSEQSWYETENKLQLEIVALKNSEKILQDIIKKMKTSILNNGEKRNTVFYQSSKTSDCESYIDCVKEMADKNIGTGDFLDGVMGSLDHGKPVSSMFERIQSLEAENQDLATKLNAVTATDAKMRFLSDKVKSLEQNEDALMERVMELEDKEDKLKRELNKLRQSTMLTTDLEEQLFSLQQKEMELNRKVENLQQENVTLTKNSECSKNEKLDIAERLIVVQKLYDDEKKKVDSFLKGEEKWMKSMSSDKKKIDIMEQEITKTQQKIEELQIDYKSKLSEKDNSEKVLKEELNKVLKEKEILKKKLQDYELSNSELEDEIAACKISESRMFHKHQQLITQNQELESKLSKLAHLLPNDSVVGQTNVEQLNSICQMPENSEVVSTNSLTSSLFNETELELLRSKTPDTELLGSVPLEMLRKMQEFDQREHCYQTKIQELESKSSKLVTKLKIVQSKEKDLKHEIRLLQLELLTFQDSNSSLMASTSYLDFDKSESDDDMDCHNQLLEESNKPMIYDIKYKDKNQFDVDSMSQEELALSIKLLEEKQKLDGKRIMEFSDCFCLLKELFGTFNDLISTNNIVAYISGVEVLKDNCKQITVFEDISQPLVDLIEFVTSLKHRIEALQESEEKLCISLAENELATDHLNKQSKQKIEQLEAQIHVLAKVCTNNLATSELKITDDQSALNKLPVQGTFLSPVRKYHLEISKIISIEVLPTDKVTTLQNLCQSETVVVDVAPDKVLTDQYLDSENNCGQPYRMMDKAEDVLKLRIRELEKLEKHLKIQVSDLETDRDELHNITHKDKAIIHEQKVRIHELQLAQQNLQEQIKSYESSESALYARLNEVEVELDIKEDKVKHLEILEQRLKDLVKQYKLDEKILATKSETLESSVKEMSQKEQTLKQKVQNLESEKTAFCERSEYLQMRLKEIENAEFDLAQKARNQENIMQTLQNTVIQLETYGANAHARVVELEHVNFDLQQRLHHSMSENSLLIKQLSAVEQECDKIKMELNALHDTEKRLLQEKESLSKNENSLQHELQTFRMKNVEMESKLRSLESSENVLQEKVSKLQSTKTAFEGHVQDLETSGEQVSTGQRLSKSHSMSRDPMINELVQKLPLSSPFGSEDIHWLEIESRIDGSGRGNEQWVSVGKATSLYTNARKSQGSEDLELGLALQSETDVASQNDTNFTNHLQPNWNLQSMPLSGNGPPISVNSKIKHCFGSKLPTSSILKGNEVSCHTDQLKHMDQNAQPGFFDNMAVDDQHTGFGTITKRALTLRERLAQIEKQLSARETDSEHELNSKANLTSWKASVQESNRKLEQVEKENEGHVKARPAYRRKIKMNKLEKELKEKARLNIQLESLYKTVQSIVQQKGSTSDIEDVINKLEAEVKNITSSLDKSGLHIDGDVKDVAALSSELSKKERELTAKRHEVDVLMCELRQWQQECRTIEDMRTNALDSLRGLELEISELQLADKQLKDVKHEYNTLKGQFLKLVDAYKTLQLDCQRLEDIVHNRDELDVENAGLRSKVTLVEQQMSILEEINKEKKELEQQLIETKTQLQELKKVETEKSALEQNMGVVTELLNERMKKVDLLTEETFKLRKQLAAYDRYDYKQKQDHVTVKMPDRNQIALGHSHSSIKRAADINNRTEKVKLSAHVATLNTRIVQLTNMCNKKDVFIKKLVHELKKIKAGGRSLHMEEHFHNELKSDYNHNQLYRSSSHSSLDCGETVSCLSDTELIRESHARHKSRPRSADLYHHHVTLRDYAHRNTLHSLRQNESLFNPSSMKSSKHEHIFHSQHLPSNNESEKTFLVNWAVDTECVAMADYNPFMFSRSGDLNAEIAMKEGDTVIIKGPLQDNGYIEAEISGHTGLVPVGYLQLKQQHPVLNSVGSLPSQHSTPQYFNTSREKNARIYKSGHGIHQNNTVELPTNRRTVTSPKVFGPLKYPEDFHVEKVIGINSLMLAWTAVAADNTCNNGVKVTGYRIFTDNKITASPMGYKTSTAIIENINIHTQHRFGIQTIGADGLVSQLSEIIYEGIEDITSDENSDTKSEMDMVTKVKDDIYKKGPKRNFMAVYDYDPSKNSPYDHPTCELAFNAGDVITVYGRQRADGFYYGEINGVQGLVPTFFIEEMPQPPPRTKKIALRSRQRNDNIRTSQVKEDR